LKKLIRLTTILLSISIQAQTFIKNLGNASFSDGATSIVKSEKGFIIAGYNNKSAYLSEIDKNGKVLWKDQYQITKQQDLITDMKYHNGKIIVCGYGYYEGTGNFLDFFFKYDIKTKRFDWIKKSQLTLKPSTIQILPNGNYLMTGDEVYLEDFKIFLMEIDANSGKRKQYSSWKFTGNESASTAVIHKNNIYIGGRYALEKKMDKYRGAISKFDFNFNEKWSNYYINNKKKYVRNYLSKLIIDNNNNILAIFSTNNYGIGNAYNITFAAHSIDGEPIWTKEYMLDDFDNVKVRDIKATSDAYYIYGFTLSPTEELFLLKTDKKGKLLWSKTYGSDFPDNIHTDQGNFMEIDNDYLYLIGQSRGVENTENQSYYNSILMKTKLDGTFDMDCWGKNIKVKTTVYKELVKGGISLTGSDSLVSNGNLAYKKENLTNYDNSSYWCYPKLAVNDFDTIKLVSTISIDFLKNDIVPTDVKTSYKLITEALNGTIIIEDKKIIYTQKDKNICIKDSFQYEISSISGVDTATVFVYTLKNIDSKTNAIEVVMPLEKPLVLDAMLVNVVYSNAKYKWSTNENKAFKQVNKPGKYSVDISSNNCLYRKEFLVLENPYSFENVAATNITFLLDVSTSMNRSNRLPVLKNALFKILSFMRDEDKLSIINYSNNAKIIFDGVQATETEKIQSKIDSLNSKGNSNILKGLKMAIELSEKNYTTNGNNRIILTTDGDVSNEKRKEMISYIQKYLPKNISFSLFLFNDATLFKEQMNDVTNKVAGVYYNITSENIDEILLKEFKSVRK